MSAPPAVVVAVPAHDEHSTIAACLNSVITAAAVALRSGAIGSATIGVCAHRCTDRTVEVAREALAGPGLPDGVRGLLVVDTCVSRVGAVRARLIDRLDRSPGPTADWILSTDADSTVPAGWIVDLLQLADRHGADALVGPVELAGWHGSPDALERYRAIVAAGITTEGHRHVYAANLAVRATAYRAVGGFRAVEHGEEHALVHDLRAAGFRVVPVLRPVVTTSARLHGRAPGGLADLLRALHEEERIPSTT